MEIGQGKIRPKGLGCRHSLTLLGFFAFACSYAMRFNLSLAIVAMVSHGSSGKTGNSSCPGNDMSETIDYSQTGYTDIVTPAPEFTWTEAEQGFILGSFFWGYVLTQVPGGMMSQRYGGKWVCGVGLGLTAVLTMVIPMAARFSKNWLIGVRVMQGLCEGVTIPAMQVVLSKWLPPDERSKLATLVYSGISIGTALTMIVTGYLIEWFAWPAVFYGIGILSMIWFVAWSLIVFDRPELHPRITREEMDYINYSIQGNLDNRNHPTPWKQIFMSLPVIAIFIAQTSNAWGLYTLLTELPTYMRTVMDFDIEQNSWISASPHVCMFLIATIVTHVADLFIQKGYARVITMRKVCNSISQWGTSVALIGAAYSGCNRWVTVILLNLAVGQIGAGFGGFLVNSIDIAPNHAGVIMGIGNAFANLCGFGAPYVAGEIISGDPSIEQWRMVFLLAAGILVVGNLFYVIFAKGEEMEWNRVKDEPVIVSKVRRFSAMSESIQLKVN